MEAVMIRSVLVTVDGSEPAGRAVDLAREIAAKCGAALTLLHVQARSGLGTVPEDLREFVRIEHVELTEAQMYRQAGEELLRRAEARAREAAAAAVSTALELGDPAGVIAEYAKANAVDLVVMGRRGLGALGGLLLGSVSHKVTQLAPCACMTVP
jgi:nucleotide-binding universal stress UspA family protein